MIILDTDHLSILADGRSRGHGTLLQRLQRTEESPAVTIVSVE
jgi:hypothetical protein